MSNNADTNLAVLLLDRLDVAPDDDASVDQITEIVRGLAADRSAQAAEIARLSAALAEKSAQLEEERARNAWQHISTAPANHEVLACNAAGYVGRAVLLKGKWEHIGMPTHWMPLPSLPTDKSKES